MAAPRLRTLGLSVPVADVLDPKLWRSRMAHGISLGQDVQNFGSIAAALCIERGDTSPTAYQEAITELQKASTGLPDDTIRWPLRAAFSELEIKLGIPFGIVICKSSPVDEGLVVGQDYDRAVPRLPYSHGDAANWYSITLPSSVISVERVRAFYYGQLIWEFSTDRGNTDQIRIEWDEQGAIHLLPINFQGLIVTQAGGGGGGNYGVWHTLAYHSSPVPDFWSVDYTLGPRDRQTGQAGHIEAALAQWVYAAAGIPLLSMAGLGKSQGLTSTSLSFDGISKSVGLQASAIYGLNSALEHVLEQITKRIDWKQAKRYKKGLRIRAYSY